METNLFLKEFIKDKNVGAIAPTSNHIAKKIIKKINFKNASIIIEYGPGDGTITKLLLDYMKPDAVLFVFEINKNFIDNLCKISDSRLFIINSDAENAKSILKNEYKIECVDYIISTIPFSFIEKHKRRRIITNSFKLLKEKGQFITYQYSWLIFNLLKINFNHVKWNLVLLNLPPVVIIDGRK